MTVAHYNLFELPHKYLLTFIKLHLKYSLKYKAFYLSLNPSIILKINRNKKQNKLKQIIFNINYSKFQYNILFISNKNKFISKKIELIQKSKKKVTTNIIASAIDYPLIYKKSSTNLTTIINNSINNITHINLYYSDFTMNTRTNLSRLHRHFSKQDKKMDPIMDNTFTLENANKKITKKLYIPLFYFIDLQFSNDNNSINLITIYNSQNIKNNRLQFIIKNNNLNPLLQNFLIPLIKAPSKPKLILNIPESSNLNKHSNINLIYTLILNQLILQPNIKNLNEISFQNKDSHTTLLSFKVHYTHNNIDQYSSTITLLNLNYITNIYPIPMDTSYPFKHAQSFIKLVKFFLFHLNINITTQAITPSTLAFNIYKNHYYKSSWKIMAPSSKYSNIFSSVYMTQPIETYYYHLNQGYHYDVNSLYPFVMLNKFPIGNQIHYKFTTPLNSSNLYGFYYISINLPQELEFNLLPYKNEKLNNIIAPKGEWTGWYFSEEVKLAQQYGYQIKIHEIIHYPKTDFIFKDYVNKYYKLKQNAKDKTTRSLTKLLLNSLYGKFAQIIDKHIYTISKKDKEIKLIEDNSNINFNYRRHENVPLIHIAAIITSYARIHMFKQKMKYKNNQIAYADTDSIILKKAIKKQEISETEIGKLKLKSKFKEGYFQRPKLYAYIDTKTSKEELVSIYSNPDIKLNDYKILTKALQNNKPIEITINVNLTSPTTKSLFPIQKEAKTQIPSHLKSIPTRLPPIEGTSRTISPTIEKK